MKKYIMMIIMSALIMGAGKANANVCEAAEKLQALWAERDSVITANLAVLKSAELAYREMSKREKKSFSLTPLAFKVYREIPDEYARREEILKQLYNINTK